MVIHYLSPSVLLVVLIWSRTVCLPLVGIYMYSGNGKIVCGLLAYKMGLNVLFVLYLVS